MGEQAASTPAQVIARLHQAINRHDLEAFVGCFAPDYVSASPLHPADAYRGREQVRARWAAAFGAITDFHADLVRCSVDGATAWTEWHWCGTWPNGTPLSVRGVIIFEVRDAQIVAGRLYMEPEPDGLTEASVAAGRMQF